MIETNRLKKKVQRAALESAHTLTLEDRRAATVGRFNAYTYIRLGIQSDRAVRPNWRERRLEVPHKPS
jgi:hypothetical protein